MEIVVALQMFSICSSGFMKFRSYFSGHGRQISASSSESSYHSLFLFFVNNMVGRNLHSYLIIMLCTFMTVSMCFCDWYFVSLIHQVCVMVWISSATGITRVHRHCWRIILSAQSLQACQRHWVVCHVVVLSLFLNHSSHAAPAASASIVTTHVFEVVKIMLFKLLHGGSCQSSFPTFFQLHAQHIVHDVQHLRPWIKFQ